MGYHLGQFVSFLICAAYLRHPKTFRVGAGSFRPSMALLKPVMALGTSSLLTQLSIVVITVVNNVLLVKYGARSVYGADIPLAAFVVIMKLFQIVLNIAIGIAAGAQPIVGYNYGAKNYGRVRELLKLMVKWTAIVGLVCIVLFEAVPGVFIRMFGSASDPVYFDFAVLCLRIYLSLILVTCVQKVCAIFLQSIGKAKAAAPLSVLRDVLLIVFSLLIPVFMGVTGIFWAAPAADVLAIFVTAAVMVRVWKELGQEKEEREPAAAAIRPSRQGTVITIAREHGSAGKGHPPYCGRRFLRYHRALGGLCAASLSECGAYLYLCPGKLPGEKGNGDVRGQPGGCEKEHCKIGCRKERIL